MAKRSGMGNFLVVDTFDASGDINSLPRISGSMTTQDVPNITQEGQARIGLLHDGAIDWMAYWNPGVAANDAHNIYSTLPTVDRGLTFGISKTLGASAASMVGKQINYDGSRGADGSFTFSLNALANGYGLQWGELVTSGILSLAASDEEPSIDNGASSAHGAQLYLNVLSFTGTSVFIGMDHSTDNAGADPFAAIASGALESEVTAAGTFRKATAAGTTIKRYVRLYASGTFSEVTFVANFVRNESALA